MIKLYPHQKEAVEKLHNGSILCGDVGTGKSLTALYYYKKEMEGSSKLSSSLPLYIITTARKRDTGEWEKELSNFNYKAKAIDSWNNIKKYSDVKGAFFIFDEQRVVGYGQWSKNFIKITKSNKWILLTATPGDTWTDYIPVFVANGYYKNKRDFENQHAVYSRFSKYPKIERFVNVTKLAKIRNDIVVHMKFQKHTVPHDYTLWAPFNNEQMKMIFKTRWDPYKEEPIQDAAGLCYALRKTANSDPGRIEMVASILKQHNKAIIFYNFDYELDLLKEMADKQKIAFSEWNGHKHEDIPKTKSWIYLVQYAAGAEGWNCTETDTIIFYSQSYSYKMTVQAAGRINRLNTPFTDLYYYHLCSKAGIDLAIKKAIAQKKNFNEKTFAGKA